MSRYRTGRIKISALLTLNLAAILVALGLLTVAFT